MCGIAGFLFSSRKVPGEPDQILRAMTTALVARGPDDAGHWVDTAGGVALGHRRLSVVDLSPAGHQPMISRSGRYVLVFNGEIYNHQEIRAELQASLDGPWRGSSDTESLLAAIEAWGVEGALRRCVGMFAFALWDKADRVLVLARDRLGEKPLYYGTWAGMLVFASELKAFHAIPGFSPALDRDALWHYFCQKAVPAPLSIYEDIKKLEPGQILSLRVEEGISLGNARLTSYWSLRDALIAAPFSGTAEEAVLELKRLMLQSIRSQMVADVPVGAFLSGGIDSSTVVALMQSVSDRKVQTYSIGFEEANFNEADHAALVANHLGTQHQELTVTPEEARAVIPRLAEIWDEPFADSSQIPTALLAALARSEVTVALSGDGGDELFCGYKRQLTASAIERIPGKALLSTLLFAFGSSSAQILLRSLPVGKRPKDMANRLRILSETLSFSDPYQRYKALALQPEHWTFVLSDRSGGRVDMGSPSVPSSQDMLTVASAFDTLTYLPTDILAKVDRASMAVSLETRVPLLDHRIVEFAFSLPSSFKVRDGQTKWPLRQILDAFVPSALVNRPKMGFSVPIAEWIRGPLRSWAEDLLFSQGGDEFLNERVIRNIWRDHQSRKWNYEEHLWRVLMFRAWQERYA